MARQKRINQRGEQTRRKLLDAVAEIMREHGFVGLTAAQITKWALKDKNAIPNHFDSLVNLKKAYIKEKDYWPPFFERFKLSSDADAIEMEGLFAEVMKENFRFFESNEEMQKIILWQISEESPLLRSISEAREKEAAKLLSMTDPFFRFTEINYRAVMALLLGGIYYIVLHSNTNKSVVCGLNIHVEKERNELLRTIEQIVSWAWKQATHHKLGELNAKKMNYEFEGLENLASQFLKRAKEGNKVDFSSSLLIEELKRVEEVLLRQLLAITDSGHIENFLKINLHRLVGIADNFYDGGRESFFVEARLVLATIHKVCGPVMEMVPGSLKLPKLFVVEKSVEFDKRAIEIANVLSVAKMDKLLIRIVLTPFRRFSEEKRNLKWSDYRYLNKYALHLEGLLFGGEKVTVSEDQIIDVLIELGLNHVTLISFFAMRLKEKMLGLRFIERSDLLFEARKRVSQLSLFVMMCYERDKMSTSAEILKWLDAEIEALREEPAEIGLNVMKIRSRMRVLELAFWQKLQYDHGVYEEDNLDVFTDKIAHNFSSKGQEVLSGKSIKSKLYGKELSVISATEKLLVEMLEDVRRFL
ncbi:hypothetical protein GM921_14990 [Pedobacter sp. LMG 31464]|uniref:Transcriptional regulator, TetR family n=1 Tax=Pedobacter planticolens TaxID=2679964 RepID=A0A923DZ98_9SPHI|nr:TetR/AcrR family transcriptional regulator [Pedobacter planticolens]MBB2146807.1 hypothetical protein [Pedobacter planticolens]